MKHDAFIFDLDGTLLDTLDDIADAANAVLSVRGLPTHATRTYAAFIGDGVRMLIVRALPDKKRTDDLIDELESAYRKAYARNWNVKTKPYDGIPALLDEIVRRGGRLSVLSNKPDDFTQQCVEAFLSKWEFVAVLGGRDDIPRKPDPTGAKHIMAEMNATPDRVLLVGDSGVDMATAVAAGAVGVGALWGFRDRDELVAAGAKVLVGHPQDVLELI